MKRQSTGLQGNSNMIVSKKMISVNGLWICSCKQIKISCEYIDQGELVANN